MTQMQFDAETLQSRLSGKLIGCRVFYRDSADSTNRIAMKLACEGGAEGTVVLADRQTAGRGRLHRVWQSPPGCNLYASLLLHPDIAPAEAVRITLLAGVVVAETIIEFCGAEARLKWPNDVLIRGRKVCGILTEMRAYAGTVESVVVGIGLNVNMIRDDFDPGHRDTSTSLREETGRVCSREDIVFLLCEHFEERYRSFLNNGFVPVRERWLALSDMDGKQVRVNFGNEIREGVFAGIDMDGALLLADGQGVVQRIAAGDASIMKG